MSESSEHARLIDAIISHIRCEYANIRALALCCDIVLPLGSEKPPRIGGYVPDVYAIDAPHTVTIIGEAKTATDLQTQRSRAQINEFYDFLSYQRDGNLILAVPIQAIGAAKNVISAVRRRATNRPVRVKFISA